MTIRLRAISIVMATLAVATLTACDSADDRAKAHFESGVQLLEKGEPEKAQLEFRNVVKLQPNNTEARLYLARYLKSKNDLRGAMDQFRAVSEIDDKNLESRLELAEMLLVANQIDTAAHFGDAAYALDPQSPRARAVKASIDYKRGDKDAAVAIATEVLKDHPDNTTARLVLVAQAADDGDFQAALKLLDAGLKVSPDDLSMNVLRLGMLEKLNRPDDIGPQLQRMVDLYPRNDQFRGALARWYAAHKDYDAAEAQYRAIAANNPQDFTKSLDVARFLNAVKGPDAAREELERLAAQPGALVEYELAIAALDLREGDEAAAVARLDRLIEERSKDQGGYKAALERAKIHIKHDELAAADVLLDAVLKNDPKNEEALILRATRQMAAADNEAAIRDLRSALDVAPNNVKVMLLLAAAYERDGSRELALERLAQAVQTSNYDPQVVLRYSQALVKAGKMDVASSILADALARRGDQRDLLVALGQIRLREEDWRAIDQIAARLSALNPDDVVAGRLKAAAALGQKQYSQSADILQNLLTGADSTDSDGLIALIRALMAGGDELRAEEVLNDRLNKNPADATALVLRASILQGRDDMAGAERDLLKAIEIEPDNAAAYASLARIYNAQGRQDEVDAILAKGLQLSDNDVQLRVTEAMQAEYQDDFDKALEIYAGLYEERPDSAVIANNYASLLADHRAADPAELQRAFNIAKRFRDSNQPQLMDTYGWLLHLTGDSKAALPILRRAADALSVNPLVQYHLGVVLAANGDYDQARERIKRALQLSEQTPFAQKARAEEALTRIVALEAQAKQDAASGGTTGSATSGGTAPANP